MVETVSLSPEEWERQFGNYPGKAAETAWLERTGGTLPTYKSVTGPGGVQVRVKRDSRYSAEFERNLRRDAEEAQRLAKEAAEKAALKEIAARNAAAKEASIREAAAREAAKEAAARRITATRISSSALNQARIIQQAYNQQQKNYENEIANLNQQFQNRKFNWQGYNQKAEEIYNRYSKQIKDYEKSVEESGKRKQEKEITEAISQTQERQPSVIERIYNRLPPSIQNILKKSEKPLDVVTLGALWERRINKKEEKLSEDIENFNNVYGNKELYEDAYLRAEKISQDLQKRQEEINNERDILASSLRSKTYGALYPLNKRLTLKQQEEKIRKNQPLVQREEQELKKVNQKIESLQKASDPLSKFNLSVLKGNKAAIEREIERLRTGRSPTVLMGELPLSIPAASIPKGVNLIKFVGTQKRGSGGKIITNIIYQTSTGRVGLARGVTAVKGKNGISVFLGRSGEKFIRFPSGKTSIGRIQSFAGVERSVSARKVLKLQEELNIAGTAAFKNRSGNIQISRNIMGIIQRSIGKVATAPGKKLRYPAIRFPSGRIFLRNNPSLRVSDFISLSKILTKGDLSAIVGNSITREGSKAKFIGLIKGISDVNKFSFSPSETGQYAAALKKVISQMAGAVAAAESTGNKSNRLYLAAINLKNIPPLVKTLETQRILSKPAITPTKKFQTLTFQIEKQKIIPKSALALKSGSQVREEIKQSIKLTQREKQLLLNKVRLGQGYSQKYLQRELQKIRQRLIFPQRTIQKLKFLSPPRIKTGQFPGRPFRPFEIRFVRRKGISPKISGKEWKFFDVYAKPIKRGGRFIKVNKSPLSLNAARDLRNYITDTSLSRTALTRPSRNRPGRITINFPRGYAEKTNRKFRNYRIVRGKKVPLTKGRVIELSRYALDTPQEKKKIDLLRRIKQLQIMPGKAINRPNRLIKGSREAKNFMANLRGMRKR